MIKINKDSDWYPVVANAVSTFVGFGSMLIVGALSRSVIDNSNQSGFKKLAMTSGVCGLETMTIFSVSSMMREQIDDLVDGYNEIAEAINNNQKG